MGSQSTSAGLRPGRVAQTFQALFRQFERVLEPQDGGPSRASRLAEQIAQDEIGLTSRFGREFLDLEQQLTERAIQGDPLARAQREGALQLTGAATQGLQDILSGELPADVRRTIEQDLRASQAARGVLDSGTAGVEEAARLAGGREFFRAQRLGQAAGILGGGLGLMNLPPIRARTPAGFNQLGIPTGGVLPALTGLGQAAGAQRTSLQNQFVSGGFDLANTALLGKFLS